MKSSTKTVAHNGTPFFTIGYSGRTLDGFVSTLLDAKVDRVVDVRALPLSRRKGFSKTPLSEALTSKGIEYVHLREAGNPFRDQKNDISKCLVLYAGYIATNPGVVAKVEAALDGHRAALLCVEAKACECHRSVIVEGLIARNPTRTVSHL